MPGISCPRPTMISTEPESMFVGNFCIGSPWEPRNSSRFQHPAVGRVPLVPVRHKSCRPSNIQAPWLNSKLNKIASDVFISSNDSENDLAAMVHDFIEGSDGYDSSDKESPTYSAFALFFEKLKALISSTSFVERQLRSNVLRTLLLISEDRLVCRGGSSCNGRCIRSILVKGLRAAGYDAAICITRWPNAGRVPGGEYEYIDVLLGEERYIVDFDFQSHFEIARPVANYSASLRLLPTVFIGSPKKLRKVLEAMSDAAKSSLKQSSMHLPPWRTLEYMRAKWFSPHQRVTKSSKDGTTNTTDPSNNGVTRLVTSPATEPSIATRTGSSRTGSTAGAETTGARAGSTSAAEGLTARATLKTGSTTATAGTKTGSGLNKAVSSGIKAGPTAAAGIQQQQRHRIQDAVARLQLDREGCSLQLKRIRACLLLEDDREL